MSNSKNRENKIPLIAKLLISAGLLCVLLFRVDFHSLWKSVTYLDFGWMLAGFMALWTAELIQTFRWNFLLKAEGTRIPFRILFQGFMVGHFFGSLLPTFVGTDMVRAFFATRYGISMSRSLAIVLLGRIIGISALLVVMMVFLYLGRDIFIAFSVPSGDIFRWTLAIIGAIAALFVMSTSKTVMKRFADNENPVADAVKTMGIYRKKKRFILGALVISVVFQITILTKYFFISKAMGLGLDFFFIAVVTVLVIILTMIPVTIDGIGLRESGFVYFLGLASVPLEKALLFAFLNYFLMLLVALTGGVIYLFQASGKQHTQIQPLKQMLNTLNTEKKFNHDV